MHSNKTNYPESSRTTNGHCIRVENGHPQNLAPTKIEDGRIYTGVPTNSFQNHKMSNKVKGFSMTSQFSSRNSSG